MEFLRSGLFAEIAVKAPFVRGLFGVAVGALLNL
jgi:hypothetical protein